MPHYGLQILKVSCDLGILDVNVVEIPWKYPVGLTLLSWICFINTLPLDNLLLQKWNTFSYCGSLSHPAWKYFFRALMNVCILIKITKRISETNSAFILNSTHKIVDCWKVKVESSRLNLSYPLKEIGGSVFQSCAGWTISTWQISRLL
jgi:hypothetical protein